MRSEKVLKSDLEESSAGKTGIIRQINAKEKNKTSPIKDTFSAKGNSLKPKTSLIPKLKSNNNETKGVERKFVKSAKPLKITSPSLNTRIGSSNNKKPVEGRTKLTDASYKKSEKKEESQSQPSSQKMHVRQAKPFDPARRLTSDPQVFNRTLLENGVLNNVENSVSQISEMWLKTSADLSNALKSLKNYPSLDSKEFRQESIKIQLAIQQAKSLTILKSKNAMAEAKILLDNEEALGSKLECLLHNEKSRYEKESSSFPEIIGESQVQPTENEKFGGMGDLPRRRENSNEYFIEIDDELEDENSGSRTTRIDKTKSFLLKKRDEASDRQKNSEQTENNILEKISQEMMNELSKKNDTITHLNKKIFELQKTCEEHVQLRNYLQIKLGEYHEKVQWNHVLWKQIGKLKGRIKEFQETYERLENEKMALEIRITNQEKEIEKMAKLNNLFNQKKFLFNEEEGTQKTKDEAATREAERDLNENFDKKILEEKQNSIGVLKMVLNVMLDQENLAQKQIAVFQSKIEELEKAAKI